MDATKLLKKDHEAVRQLFAEFESAESDESKLVVYEDVRGQLLVHARIEEEMFYPAIREADPEKGERQVEEALTEHQQVKQMLVKLDEMAAEVDANFAETVRKLARSVEHHVQEEENDIFLSARKMGEKELDELGDRLQQRKDQLMQAGIQNEEQSA
jgi:hemerythrin superfamily protein